MKSIIVLTGFLALLQLNNAELPETEEKFGVETGQMLSEEPASEKEKPVVYPIENKETEEIADTNEAEYFFLSGNSSLKGLK